MGVSKRTWFLAVVLMVLANIAHADHALRYAGATTLQRFYMPEVARYFTDATAIKVHIEGGNTGPGISALLKGEVDMAGAGRFLTDAEKKKGLVEHLLGWDVLSIIVHANNPIDTLTLDQLQGIFSGEISDWQNLGGKPGPIVVVTCPQGSGMRSSVKKLILREKEYSAREIVSAIVAEADQQVSMFQTGITALSKSMLDAKQVKAIKVNGISPTAASIADGSYPLAKPLTLVTLGKPEGELARFFDVVNSPQGQAALRKSFVPVQ